MVVLAEEEASGVRPAAAPSEVLKHPTRVRILEIVNERDLSPIGFVNAGQAPGMGRQKALSHVAHHFRVLHRTGYVELAAQHQRRGAMENVFRSTARGRAYLSDADWIKLSPEDRRSVSATVAGGLFARVEGAMQADTFDARENRWLVWRSMKLDEQGWSELMGTIETAYADAEQIRHDAEKRLEETGVEVVPATVGMMGFESPPPA